MSNNYTEQSLHLSERTFSMVIDACWKSGRKGERCRVVGIIERLRDKASTATGHGKCQRSFAARILDEILIDSEKQGG